VQAIYGIILTTLLATLPGYALAQRGGRNLYDFEYRNFHFGTMLGTNTTTYSYTLNPANIEGDSIKQIAINRMPGFAIHIPVVSWNPHSTVNIRTVPSISFHETEFSYTYLSKGKLKTKATRTQPTLLNFPILLKLNTKRINNFSAYAISGFSYSIDLASQEDVDQGLAEQILKLKKHDFAYHVGGGFDFYMPYFKFGMEIKLSNGLTNLLIQDDTFFSSPLSSLKSHTWWFSITFEG
jgi:hypothetical protein